MKLTECAAKLDATGKYSGICITLNPCNPALLARCCNRVETYTETATSDPDIIRRRWLLIDFDPKRPPGISSTDREHQRAITAACGAWDDLRGAGLGDPVVADSGNGTRLLYCLDWPNNSPTTDLIKRVLAGVPPAARPTTLTPICLSSMRRESLKFTGSPTSSIGHSRNSRTNEGAGIGSHCLR
jgi:hypothetical protein